MRLLTILLLLSSALLCSGAKIDDIKEAAEQGNAIAQLELGLMHANGEGVDQDDAEAVKWWRKAAGQGHAEAQYNLGIMYASGKGEARDYVEAVKWFRKAADQGHAWAQYRLGAMYDFGRGVAEDDVMAYMWWNLAAAQGNDHSKRAKGMLSEEMTREQIAEAQKLSREWSAKRSM